MRIKEKLKKYDSGHRSNWINELCELKENENWLNMSSMIAIRILRVLDFKNLTQKDLAETLGISAQGVSKILQGNENLSLETICKLESALGVKLLQLPDYNAQTSFQSQEYSNLAAPTTSNKISLKFTPSKTLHSNAHIIPSKERPSMHVVYSNLESSGLKAA